ncbi:MAG: hypothetical protein P1U65_02890 [Minwuia sp.]|nr:hypothetical protein [Minwuia sp.]
MADPTSAAALLSLSGIAASQQMSAASATRKLSRARSRLELASKERDNQQQLAQNLARQNVVGGARGVSASSGSLMRQAMAARRAIRRGNSLARASTAIGDAQADQRARAHTIGSLIDFGRAGVGFGKALHKA